jgi:hypothetical protein
MTLDATMIENNPEVRRMFLAAAAKQEGPILLKYKYDKHSRSQKEIISFYF